MSAAWDDPRIASGMRRQLHQRRELLQSGEQPLGWKLAFGAPAAMERLHLSAPLVGYLLQSAAVPSGSTLSVRGWTKPAAEPELAVYLGKKLAAGSDRKTTAAAIAGLGAAIELADVDHPSEDVEGTLARNIYQRHVVVSPCQTTHQGGALTGLVARVLRSGTELANTTQLEALTGELIEIVGHVANLLDAFGETLDQGHIIITGSITPPIWMQPGDEIVFELKPFDAISVKLDQA